MGKKKNVQMELGHIRVDKEQLIERLYENRNNHQAEYEKAVAAYRARAIEELEQMLKDARNGVIRRQLTLPIPEVHIEDYDRAIEMLEWADTDSIWLSTAEFSSYVRNQWGWMQSYAANTQSYIG